MTMHEILDVCDRTSLRRTYRGPIDVLYGLDIGCPYCRNSEVHECPACGLMTCAAAPGPSDCPSCHAVGETPPSKDPTLPAHVLSALEKPYRLHERFWDAWIAMFHAIDAVWGL